MGLNLLNEKLQMPKMSFEDLNFKKGLKGLKASDTFRIFIPIPPC